MGVQVSHDLNETVLWADAVNMLRIQLERQSGAGMIPYFPSLREYAQGYGLTRKSLARRTEPLTILHPGPINRGVEISSELADGQDAIILDQVENGVAVRMAVLYQLASKR
jgi:aspartate carbamoyltransferase catalytic subunit